MDSEFLSTLNKFVGAASKATYAGGGGKVGTPERSGFIELEYHDDNWCYRDSYTGFLRSWGQEVVRYKDKPIWVCSYGGGMTDSNMDEDIAEETFTFLKKVLLVGDKENQFQPRGPLEYIDGDWEYRCTVKGTIKKFKGHEAIRRNGKMIFTHDFFGGLVRY
jgi:hypothetical protein